MNDRFKTATIDDRRFDRLVDGELSPAEYEALLTALDAEPEMWRRCALAFLEAQAWRGEMSAIRRGQGTESPSKTPASKPVKRPWRSILAIAASFVVAFFGGLMAQRQFDGWRDDAHLARIAKSDDAPGELELANSDAAAGNGSVQQDSSALGNIRLVVDGGLGRSQQIEVPVYDLDKVGLQFLAREEPLLAPEVVQQLERRGRKVQWSVDYLPLPLDENRQIVVPVEQYQITPVSRRTY
jgi:anti-sigma factor RsiW